VNYFEGKFYAPLDWMDTPHARNVTTKANKFK